MTTESFLSEEQRFLFDTDGYIVVPNVLTENQVEELRSTIQRSTEQFPPVPQSLGPLHWGKIWRDLLDWPQISPILEELIGNPLVSARRIATNKESLPTFRLDHINVHTHVSEGFKGGVLHGGWNSVAGYFRYVDGVFYNGMTTVSFELYDTHPNDGGFACIPGTHKGNVSLPEQWRDLSKGIPNCVRRVSAKPGDAIIFTEALTHGTLPWQANDPRLTVFYKFSPHTVTWAADFFDPEDFRNYEDIDDRKLAILEPPNARYARRPTDPETLES